MPACVRWPLRPASRRRPCRASSTGSPNVRPETRELVLAAMTALDYRVNNAARALGTRTTRTIGVIASDATLYGPAVGIAALETAAREAGRWVATAYADAADEASVAGARGPAAVPGRGRPHRARAARVDLRVADGRVPGHPDRRPAHGGRRAPVSATARRRRAPPDRSGTPPDRDGSPARRNGSRHPPAMPGPSARWPIAGLEPGPRWSGDWSAAAGARARSRDRTGRAHGRGSDRDRRGERPDGARAHGGSADGGSRGARRGQRHGLRRQPGCRVLPPAAHHGASRPDGEARRGIAAVLGAPVTDAPRPPDARRAGVDRPPRGAARDRGSTASSDPACRTSDRVAVAVRGCYR